MQTFPLDKYSLEKFLLYKFMDKFIRDKGKKTSPEVRLTVINVLGGAYLAMLLNPNSIGVKYFLILVLMGCFKLIVFMGVGGGVESFPHFYL